MPTDADQTDAPDTAATDSDAADAATPEVVPAEVVEPEVVEPEVVEPEVVEPEVVEPEVVAVAEPPVPPPAKPAEPPRPNKSGRTFTDAERAARKERVVKAKDALARSVGMKGDHVIAARAALKTYLQRLNDPNQPDDARFEMLVEAPFRTPPKKRTNDRRF